MDLALYLFPKHLIILGGSNLNSKYFNVFRTIVQRRMSLPGGTWEQANTSTLKELGYGCYLLHTYLYKESVSKTQIQIRISKEFLKSTGAVCTPRKTDFISVTRPGIWF